MLQSSSKIRGWETESVKTEGASKFFKILMLLQYCSLLYAGEASLTELHWEEEEKVRKMHYVIWLVIHFSPVFQPSASLPSLHGRQVFGDGTETPPSVLRPAANTTESIWSPPPSFPCHLELFWTPFLQGFRGVCVHDEALHRCDYSCCSTLGVADLKGD